MPTRYEDIEGIRRLTFEYARTVDGKDLEGVMALFTEKAVWDARGFGMTKMRGIDVIRDFYSSVFESIAHSAHLTVNHLINVNGNTASGHVYIHAHSIALDGTRAESLGYYDDTYERTGTGWKFASRSAHPLLPPPPPPVAQE